MLLILILDAVLRENGREIIVAITVIVLAGTTIFLFMRDDLGDQNMFKFGVFFRVFSAIALLSSIIVVFSAWKDMNLELDLGVFFSLLLLANIGGMLIASSRNMIPLYIGYELVSIPTYGMVAFRKRNRASAEASMKIFLLGALSSAIMIYGLSMYYGATGGFTMGLEALPDSKGLQILAVVLIAVGSGFKIGLIPFHLWIPDVYTGASISVVNFLSASSKKMAFAFVFQLFFVGMPFWANNWSILFAVLATLSMIIGNIAAVVQNRVMRIIAYSTIAQAGYIAIGIATYGVGLEKQNTSLMNTSMEGLLFHIIAHVLMKGAAIAAILLVIDSFGDDNIDNFRGLFHKDPIIAGSLAISFFSLMGIPPTMGFFGKFFLFLAAVEADMIWLAFIGVVGSAISIFYYARIIRIMADQPTDDTEMREFTPIKVLLVLLTIMTLILAVLGQTIAESAADIVAELNN
ncbi:MAG: NADH-quinone oxidoreductase subunit N [Candidatus Heimdallarchaeota archaeon]|nr:NADH-quinone oxidoreductase subunit N [Candidatus Heimdallarchaeota archaeon]